MSRFKVGDICIGQHFVVDTQYNGMECEIVESLGRGLCQGRVTGKKLGIHDLYRVAWSSGQMNLVRGFNLRKKQPPRREVDTVVSWENCAWQPKREPASITDMREVV